jgi:nitrite reductase (NADH) small subunit
MTHLVPIVNILEKEGSIMSTMTPLSRAVYNLGPVSRLPVGEGRVFQIGHTLVAIFRTRRGEVFATQASCPHKGGPLADGLIGAGKVICPLHSYSFDLATGQPIGNICKALKTYPVSLTETGDIMLSLDVS